MDYLIPYLITTREDKIMIKANEMIFYTKLYSNGAYVASSTTGTINKAEYKDFLQIEGKGSNAYFYDRGDSIRYLDLETNQKMAENIADPDEIEAREIAYWESVREKRFSNVWIYHGFDQLLNAFDRMTNESFDNKAKIIESMADQIRNVESHISEGKIMFEYQNG